MYSYQLKGTTHLQVSCKLWLCFTSTVFFTNCLSLTCVCSGMAVHSVHLLLVFYCNKYSHWLAEEELLSLGSLCQLFWCLCILCGKRENHFWDLGVMALTLLLGWTLKAEAGCFVWNVCKCLLNYTVLSYLRRPSFSVRTWNLTRLKVWY